MSGTSSADSANGTRSMANWLARAAYAALLRLALPLYLARLWRRGRREPLYRCWLGERLGFGVNAAEPGRIWVHAVSLGETLAARALIEALRAQRPGLRFLLTHGTATGRAAGLALLRPGDAQAWLPYDTPGAVRRFLQGQRPALGVLMETEVWPHLLYAAQAAAVPMLLANARLSERSLNKGLALGALLRPAVSSFTRVLAQTEDDALRLGLAGAKQVQVLGNLKFDLSPDPGQLAQGQRWRAAVHTTTPAELQIDVMPGRPVVLMASSREGEERALLDAWCRLSTPRPLLLLVPRHPQRFAEVAALVAAAGLSLAQRSTWADESPPAALQADVWLGDSVGEMALYYAAADVALLGGSFEPLGGHNLIEAAACGCPLVMGPSTYNFALAAELSLAAGAAVREPSLALAVQRAVLLARDPARLQMAARATAFAAQHRGAAERLAREVLTLLP